VGVIVQSEKTHVVWIGRAVDELPSLPPDHRDRSDSALGEIFSNREILSEGARKAGLNECATPAELKKYPKMTHLALCNTKRA
jgi:hypothetical protein